MGDVQWQRERETERGKERETELFNCRQSASLRLETTCQRHINGYLQTTLWVFSFVSSCVQYCVCPCCIIVDKSRDEGEISFEMPQLHCM